VRFKQEFRTLSDVSHENLVRLDALEQDGDRCWISMELVDGVDFHTFVRQDNSQLRPALVQLARGIAALHARGILHRDLKPSNVLVDTTERKGRVVIVDFGLAQLLRAEPQARSVEGTPAYMAPEHLEGTASTASDWYAFGVILLEALTGRPAFDVDTGDLVASKRAVVDAAALPAGNPLSDLCRRLLAPDPAQRATGADVKAALSDEDYVVDDDDQDIVVGRDAEVARVAALFRGASERGADVADKPAVVVISGPSGVGKSALLGAARDRFAAAHPDGWSRRSLPRRRDGAVEVPRPRRRRPRRRPLRLAPRRASGPRDRRPRRRRPLVPRVSALARAAPAHALAPRLTRRRSPRSPPRRRRRPARAVASGGRAPPCRGGHRRRPLRRR